MSAAEIIEQIKALPPEEKAMVMDYVSKLQAEATPDKVVRYASPDQAKAAGDKVVQQHEQVFRKLAQ